MNVKLRILITICLLLFFISSALAQDAATSKKDSMATMLHPKRDMKIENKIGPSRDVGVAASWRIMSYPAAAFTSSKTTNNTFIGQYLTNSNGSVAYFGAPLHMPQGTRLRKVIMYCEDNGAEDLALYLYGTPFGSSVNDDLYSVSSSGASSGYRDFTSSAVNKTLSTKNNVYWFWLKVPTGSSTYKFHSLKVYYKQMLWNSSDYYNMP